MRDHPEGQQRPAMPAARPEERGEAGAILPLLGMLAQTRGGPAGLARVREALAGLPRDDLDLLAREVQALRLVRDGFLPMGLAPGGARSLRAAR